MKKNTMSQLLRTGLTRQAGPLLRAILWLLSTAIFILFARYARYAQIDNFSGYRVEAMQRLSAIVFGAIFALSYAIQLHVGRKLPVYMHILLAIITGTVLLAKISLLDYVSDDYDIFLSNWIYDYSQMGIKEGLGQYIASDYTPPYLYLLQIISKVKDYPSQYLVKAISMGLEVLLGYALMKLSALRLKGESAPLMIYHLVSLLPTVVFNGAYWGQCDVIYTSLSLMALYMGLTQRSARSMVFFGLSLSFKFQTIFFLPVMLPLWLRKDIKLRHLILIPITYMVMMLPALWGGKSLHHILTVYLQQSNQYNFITMNGPNLYQFLPPLDAQLLYKMFSPMAMFLGIACIMGMCALATLNRDHLDTDATLLIALLMLIGVPTFLPKMHERYTFGADVLSLVVAAHAPRRRFLIPLCLGFASYTAYTAGLPGEKLMDLKWAAMFQLVGFVLIALELGRKFREKQDAVCTEVKV